MQGAAGIGSGLDVNTIVEQLMAVEKQPLSSLKQKDKNLQAQLSAYGTLKNAVHNFRDAMEALSSDDKFQIYKADSTNGDVITATADENASVGNYNITVSQLAQSHKISSGAFIDAQTSIAASGELELDINGEKFTVDIDANNDTLSGIRDAINFDLDNTGVKATILNVDDGLGGTESHLVLTSNNTGSASAITLTDLSGNVSSTLNLTNELSAAQDAVLDIDGFSVTHSSNLVDGVIEGVVLDVSQVDLSGTTISITRDDDSITNSVKEFVNTYNSLMTEISNHAEGSLDNDSSLQFLKAGLTDIINTPAENVGDFSYLSEIGVTTNSETGKFEFDTLEFKTALSQDFTGIVKIFSDNDEGFAARFHEYAENQDKTAGIIKIRTDGINKRINTLEARITKQESHLEVVEKRYYKQFSLLDSLMSQLDATTEYLTQQLSNMPMAGKSSKK